METSIESIVKKKVKLKLKNHLLFLTNFHGLLPQENEKAIFDKPSVVVVLYVSMIPSTKIKKET